MTDLDRYLQTFRTQIQREKVKAHLALSQFRIDGIGILSESQMAERAVARGEGCKVKCACDTGPKRNGLRLLTRPKWFLYGVKDDLEVSFEISKTCAQYVNFLLGRKLDIEKMWQEEMAKYDKDQRDNNSDKRSQSILRW